MANYSPPPTYAELVIHNEDTGQQQFNPIWMDWFIRFADYTQSIQTALDTATNQNQLPATPADKPNSFGLPVGVTPTHAQPRPTSGGTGSRGQKGDKGDTGLDGAAGTGSGASDVEQALTYAASIAWNMSLGKLAYVTLTGNATLAAPTNLGTGTCVLIVIQDGTGGRTLHYNAVFKFPGGMTPVLSTGAGKIDILTFVQHGGALYGVAQKAFA